MSARCVPAKEIAEAVRSLVYQANIEMRPDIAKALRKARRAEESRQGRRALDQILENAKIAKAEQLPLCQDTGYVSVFLEVGDRVLIEGDLKQAVNTGVASGYQDGYFRPSMVSEPVFERPNTGDNTPALLYLERVAGQTVRVTVMPKGAGSDNASRLVMLRPTAGLEMVRTVVTEVVRETGPRACPPLIVGLGLGGSFDTAAGLSKQALLRSIDSHHKEKRVAKLEDDLLKAINDLGIGPGALGGCITALGVNIEMAATHMALLPVAVNVSCHLLRSASIEI